MNLNIPGNQFGIVIANDSKALCDVYDRAFETAGLKVLAKFQSSRDLLSHFHYINNAAAESIVLLGLKMRDTDGLEAARRLKELNPNQKVILTVAKSPVKFQVDKRLFDEIIYKPFTISELEAVLERFALPMSIKGSKIFSDSEEIDNLLQHIVSDAKEKLCSVLSSASLSKAASIFGQHSEYSTTYSKDISMFLVTDITDDNLAICRCLMGNGVHLRHLKGVLPNFAVWDERHIVESIRATSSDLRDDILYSNLEPIVRKNQYLFEYYWNLAAPAEQRIKELETQSTEDKLVMLDGERTVLSRLSEIIGNADLFIDSCEDSKRIPVIFNHNALASRRGSISRVEHCRILTQIERESVGDCKKLRDLGIEIRHFANLKGGFTITEKELITTLTRGPSRNPRRGPSAIYTYDAEHRRQYKEIFDRLWISATPVSDRMREINTERSRENDFNRARILRSKSEPEFQ